MSFDPRDQRVPPMDESVVQPGPAGIADAKRIAWAFAIGARRPSADPSRASRRGDLPDVDFDQAVLVPRRPIWSRIAAAFRALSSEAPASEERQLEIPPRAELRPVTDNVIPFRRAA